LIFRENQAITVLPKGHTASTLRQAKQYNHLDQKNDLCKGFKQARWAQEAEGQHTRGRHSICRSWVFYMTVETAFLRVRRNRLIIISQLQKRV
jgi:hypothetical protein